MASASHRYMVGTILLLLIVQSYAGYWICDWVNGRGWMYCSRGFCSTFGRKRSLIGLEDDTGPFQNDDATYCLGDTFCYTCDTINDRACRITLLRNPSLNVRSYSYRKRADEDLCL